MTFTALISQGGENRTAKQIQNAESDQYLYSKSDNAVD
jgi:hypothetical protein